MEADQELLGLKTSDPVFRHWKPRLYRSGHWNALVFEALECSCFSSAFEFVLNFSSFLRIDKIVSVDINYVLCRSTAAPLALGVVPETIR